MKRSFCAASVVVPIAILMALSLSACGSSGGSTGSCGGSDFSNDYYDVDYVAGATGAPSISANSDDDARVNVSCGGCDSGSSTATVTFSCANDSESLTCQSGLASPYLALGTPPVGADGCASGHLSCYNGYVNTHCDE